MNLAPDIVVFGGAIASAGFFAGFVLGKISGRISASGAAAAEISGISASLASSETALAMKRDEVQKLSSKMDELQQKLQETAFSLARAEAELEASVRHTKEIMTDRERLSDSFKVLSADIFRETSRNFMEIAGRTLAGYMDSARIEMDKRDRAVEGIIQPVREALERFDASGRVLETERAKVYGSLSEQVASLARSQQTLERETAKLVKALRQPHVRGRWGEMTLRRAAEMSGMVERCDFVEQASAEGDEGRIRPDMIITLPGGRNIIVDAKTPLSAYIDSIEAENETEKSECLKNHARQVAGHVLKLSQKNYWKQFSPTPEFVVLFIPGENFFSAALSELPDLMETASERNIVLATPSTLISLLKTVAHAWREDSVARSAKTVMEMGKELCDRIQTVASYMNRLGKDIGKCADTYNQTAASLERRVFVTARKFQSLGLSSSEIRDDLEKIDIKIRLLDESAQ